MSSLSLGRQTSDGQIIVNNSEYDALRTTLKFTVTMMSRTRPSNLSDWLREYAEPLPEDFWVTRLRTATWGSQMNGISWRDVQRDEEGERVQIDIPPRCLVMDDFGDEFGDFNIRDAYVRPEYWEILDRIVTFTQGVRCKPDNDTEMGGIETGNPNFQDHIPDNPFKSLHTKDWKVIIVTGSPGIGTSVNFIFEWTMTFVSGKSIFLHLLLRLRSNAALPTLFQIDPYSAFFVTEHGAHKLGKATIDDALTARLLGDLIPNMWCLVDSDMHMLSPSLFVGSTGCTIVQTPSPRAARMYWAKKVATDVEQFCMAPFTLQEAIIARQFHSSIMLKERELEYWYQRFTPSFRTACVEGRRPHTYEHVIRNALSTVYDPATLGALGYDVECTKVQGHTPYEIFVYFPPKDRQLVFTEVAIPTSHLVSLIIERFQADNIARRLELYHAWLGNGPMAAATERLLKDIVKEVFPKGGIHPLKVLEVNEKSRHFHYSVPSGSPSTPDCYLVVNGRTKPAVSIKPKGLGIRTKAVNIKFYGDLESDVYADGAFYLPVSATVPTFDFIHVQGRQAVLFKCTVSKKHDVEAVGLEQVEHLAQTLGIEDVIYIGVVPSGQESTTFIIDKEVALKSRLKGLYLLPFEPTSWAEKEEPFYG